MTAALVLAGGGVAGIAWELGVLRGVLDVHPELSAALLGTDVVIGTSAGAAVGAQITSGTTLDVLYAAQLAPDSAEIEVDVDFAELVERLGAATTASTGPQDLRRRLCEVALTTDTVDEEARRAAVAARLPATSWPDRRLLITAVHAATGEQVVFTKDSGVALLDAVTASCAVPGVWPPATIGSARYIDGGMRSATNGDLAAGADRVLILTPTEAGVPAPWGDLAAEIGSLGEATVEVVFADSRSVEAFGQNPLSAATLAPAAQAGRDVGRAAAPRVAALLG